MCVVLFVSLVFSMLHLMCVFFSPEEDLDDLLEDRDLVQLLGLADYKFANYMC